MKCMLTNFTSFAPVVRVTTHHLGLFGRLTVRRIFQLFGALDVGPPPQSTGNDRRVGEQKRSDGHALGRVHATSVNGPEQRLQLSVVQPFEQGVAELPLVRLRRRVRAGWRRCSRCRSHRRRRSDSGGTRRLLVASGFIVPAHPCLPQTFS